MAYPFREPSLTVELLGQTHVLGIGIDVSQNGLEFHPALLVQPSGSILGDGLDQLAQTEFHVVEVRDGLAQFNVDVGKFSLEVTEGLAGIFGIFRGHALECVRVVDED